MLRRSLLAAAVVASPLTAQTPAPPPAEQQVAAAVSTLPAEERAGASVLGYDAAGKLVSLRKGTGEMTCLGHNPAEKAFHVACYHNSMEPFMARGRALRASGVKDPEVDSVRFREVRSGSLLLPKTPAAMYQLFGGSFDPATGEVTGAQTLFVAYIPFATGKSTGISEKPSRTSPWLMWPGTPKAHIMLAGKM